MRAEALLKGHHGVHAIAILSRTTDAESLWLKAQAEASIGRLADAARDSHEAFKKLTQPEPEHYLQCADFQMRVGLLEKALQVLDDGPEVSVLIQKAISLEVQHGRMKQAMARLDKLITISQVQEPLLAQKASLLAQSGDIQASLRCWQQLSHRLRLMRPETRDSHAMSQLSRQTTQAIQALHSIVTHASP